MPVYRGTAKSSKAVKAASALAALSRCRNRHGSIILRRGQVEGASTNIFRNESTDATWRVSHIHAEVAALAIAGSRARGATLVVARVNASGELRNSKPCVGCQRAIARAGVAQVVFTVAE